MVIDEQLYQLPVVGRVIKRLYSYFKAHIFFTDMIHIVTGIGIGFILADKKFMVIGVIALSIGIAGHIFAFFRVKNIEL